MVVTQEKLEQIEDFLPYVAEVVTEPSNQFQHNVAQLIDFARKYQYTQRQYQERLSRLFHVVSDEKAREEILSLLEME